MLACLIDLLNLIAKHHTEEQVGGNNLKAYGDKAYRCLEAKDLV